MTIYATSDTHFGHDKLCELSGRPPNFGELLLADIRRHQGDILIHCGDFCIGNDQEHIDRFMEAAKGFKQKILVRGNHDRKSYSWYRKNGFDVVVETMQMVIFNKQILFSHIPYSLDVVPAFYAPVRHIHGHLHGNAHRLEECRGYDPAFHYDLAPERHDYKIVNLETIL